jgi:hypothetical protein
MGGFGASIPREETVPTRRVAASAALLLTLGIATPAVAHASTTLPVEVDATALGGLGVTVTDPDAVSGENYTIDWGDGETSTGTTGAATKHLYADPYTYTITETVTDSSGDTGTGSTSFTTPGTLYQQLGPVRILDTRKGIGASEAAVGAGDVVQLKVAGVDDIPSNVAALVP